MSDYGVFSDELPLFLGQEKLMIFERKIALKDITETWWNNNGGAVNCYRRILLGPASNTYSVFADYKSDGDMFFSWSGGGFNIGGSGLPSVGDSVFMAGKTDNSLLLENGNWYLLAFNPDGAARNTEKLNTDFYVYRTANTSEGASDYGLNVYREDGTLAYHSDWNIIRAREVRHEISRVMANGEKGRGVAMWRKSSSTMPSFVNVEDTQAAGRGIEVGSDKLVSIGHVFHATNYWDKFQSEYVRFAPYLKDGRLGYAVAFASCGQIPPTYLNQVVAYNGRPTGNPIIVIDKPKI